MLCELVLQDLYMVANMIHYTLYNHITATSFRMCVHVPKDISQLHFHKTDFLIQT